MGTTRDKDHAADRSELMLAMPIACDFEERTFAFVPSR
jgi:hypothetical protein